MINFKNKLGKLFIISLSTLSFVMMPTFVFAEEEQNPTPSESPTPTPTATPTPSESPTPTTTPTATPTPTSTPTPSESPVPTPTPSSTPTVKPTITLNKTNQTMTSGTTINIKATVTGVEGDDAKIKWTSSDTTVATVTNGVVKGIKVGKVTITASLEKNSDIKATCTVTVEEKKSTTTSGEQEETKESLNLKSLKVKGYTLNEPFSSSKTGYTVDIPYEAEDVSIEVEKVSNSTKTEIKGATNLKVGKNTVTITVKDSQGNSKVYTITVTRAAKDDSKTNSNNSGTVSSYKTSSVTSSILPESTRKDHTLKYIFVTIGCAILFAIGGLGIYFYIKTSGKDKRQKKEKKKQAKKSAKKEVSKIKEPVEVEEVVETPIVEVKAEDDLGQTIEFTEEMKELENKRNVHLEKKAESNVVKEIEDLFDEE